MYKNHGPDRIDPIPTQTKGKTMLLKAATTSHSFYNPKDYAQPPFDPNLPQTTRDHQRLAQDIALDIFFKNGGTVQQLKTYAPKY
jgi:hypothetical protein